MALPNAPSAAGGREALSTVAALPLDNTLPSFAGSLVELFRDGRTPPAAAPTPSTLPRLLLAAVASASFSSSGLALPLATAAETDGVLPVLRGGASFAAALFLFRRLAVRGAACGGGGGGGGIITASSLSCASGEPAPGDVELPVLGCGGE